MEGSQLPPWLRSSSVGWMGVLVGALAIVLTIGLVLHEYRAMEATEIQSAELYARVLQDHAERTFDTIDVATGSIAEGAHAGVFGNETAQLNQDLLKAQRGLPFLRSLSLMNAAGRVLASSSPTNIDAVVDLKAVQLPAPGMIDRLGSSVYGRDLVDAQPGLKALPSAARTFVPLVRAMGPNWGKSLFLVAVINPDFFANEYELTLADPTRSAGIFSIDGTMYAGTGNLKALPGERAGQHRFFADYLPARESGRFVGPGIDGVKVVTAFRLLRKRPVAIIVERNYASVLAGFRQNAVWMVGLCGGALVFLFAVVVMARRSLRGHEAVRAALESIRSSVAASEHDLRVIVESVHELIFRADASGRIVFVNGRWQELTDRPASDVLGKRVTDLCREDERQACYDLWNTLETQDGTLLIHVMDAVGQSLTLDLSVSRLRGPEGKTMGYAGFAVDVSAREAAQQALQSQLKFTAQLIELSPTPVFVKDERGRFVTVNRAWLELMNLTVADVVGHDSADLFGQDAPKHNGHDARLQVEERISYENRLLVEGRTPRDTVVTKVRFTRADGSPAGIVGSIVDVTEFREAERDIREARDAAQIANRAKSEFIANISHELRTPLQGIIGFSELGRDFSGALPDILDMFTDIHASGQRMLTLVNGMIDVSQIDTAAGSLPVQQIDIAQIVRDAVAHVMPQAVARSLQIKLHGLSGERQASVDHARFQQAVGHVLSNAVRYSPIGGRVDVTLLDHAAAGLELTVKDLGPGIPEDELELVFEAFVQSSRTRDGSGGTGLGLTIARKIMSAHGGSVVAANAPDGGALVSIRLPAAGAVEGAEPQPSRQDADGVRFTSEVT